MAGYLGASPVPQTIQKKQSFTATASQTTFTTTGYTDGAFINVYLNGARLINGTDYTATNNSDIVLTAGASVDDVLDFETFNEFTLVDQTLETPTFTDSATVTSTTTASVSVSGDTTATLSLKNNTHEDTDGGRESTLIFKGEQSGGEISTLAEIEASHDGTADDEKGDLIFRTNDGSDGASPTEAMRIQSDQKIGVGLSSNISSTLHVNSEVSLGPDNDNRMIVGSTSDGVGSIGTIEGGTASFSTATFKGGNVGIGESDPKADLVVKQNGSTFTTNGNTVALFQRNTATGSGAMVSILSGNNSAADLNFADADDEDVGRIRYNHSDNSMQFQTAASERMRIDSDGRAYFNTTSAMGTGVLQVNLAGTNKAVGIRMRPESNGNWLLAFESVGGSSIVGQIVANASSTSYNTSSDYRLKTDAQPMTGATDRLKQLNPINFKWIADNTRADGFLAHEAQAVVPDAVTGAKDAVDEDGNIEPQGIDQAKLVPLLTSALQEAIAKIETLETKVAALEAE